MIKALRVTGRAFGLWWQELFLLTFFNLAWLVLQLLVVTGPPATAALYAIARRVADGELLEVRDGWLALRGLFVPAWQWGAANLAIGLALAGNFYLYQDAAGLGWTALRLVWGTIGLLWLLLNLFYWPFWLAQSDRRMRTTARNSLLLLLKRPAFALTLALISAGLIGASVLITIPLAAALMCWLALIGVLAVDDELKPRPGVHGEH